MNKLLIFILAIFLFTSCESEQARENRLAREKQEQIEFEQRQEEEAIRLEEIRIEKEKQAEFERIEREERLEKERKEQEIYDKYINNSLRTGATPYSKHYGGNSTCQNYGCSQIKVETSNSDVLVLIKRNNKIVRHAFIRSGDSYTFSFPDGIYQTFFYYGKGWNPEQEMKGGEVRGGFIQNGHFEKDDPQHLSNNVLNYSLIMQQDGNFSAKTSNPEEAL